MLKSYVVNDDPNSSYILISVVSACGYNQMLFRNIDKQTTLRSDGANAHVKIAYAKMAILVPYASF